MRALFRLVAFRQLWFSTVIAAAGMGIERTLTAWLALQLGADPFTIGVMFAARMLPSLLFGLAAGTIADRYDRPRLLAAVGGAAALMMAVFGALVASGAAQIWHVVLFNFLAGCVMVFDIPARQALVLDTIAGGAAQRALSLNALAARLTGGLGSFVAGFLITAFGMVSSYAVAALVYGLMAVLIVRLHVVQEHRLRGDPPPFQQALAESIRMIAALPAVRTLIVVGLVCEIFAFSHMSAIPLFAQQVLAAGPEGLGILNAALAVGGALSVALLSLLPEHVDRKPLLGAVYMLYGAALVGFGISRDLSTAAVMLVVTGFCAGAFDVLQQTLIQLAVPAEQRGRAVGLWVLSIGSAPLGHLEMGALAAGLGVPVALLINGTLTMAAAAWLRWRAPEYRQRGMREPAP